MARATKKTTMSPAENRRNPKRRRRRRFLSRKLGAAATRTDSGWTLIGAAMTGAEALSGTSATTGSTAALIGATARGSGVTAGAAGTGFSAAGFVSVGTGVIGALAGVAAPAPVSSCSFALAGLIGAAVTTEGAGTSS